MRLLLLRTLLLCMGLLTYKAIWSQPPLLPMPRSVKWTGSILKLSSNTTIVYTDTSLRTEADFLYLLFSEIGVMAAAPIYKQNGSKAGEIVLSLDPDRIDHSELYRLNVTKRGIRISAPSRKGVFYALYTLRQLILHDQNIPTVSISDAPAFTWRGYMVDVGRNYMSMGLLKKQIDLMAAFKLNVFHFHATEDIAWRIEVPGFPELTAPHTMLRNKGSYYSVSEVKELINYCRERHITFLPEIDMPGHSAAFQRAMHCDMQSDTGLKLIKAVLRSLCETYDFTYIHIGADEVKIRNERFIPEVTNVLRAMGKEVIGWQPGGNFDDQTIRQLWMEDMKAVTGSKPLRYIDSRHLYLNHMDPLEAVTTIYNRQLSNKDHGDSLAMGATLCLWHDRRVDKEEDLMQMNPVMSGMITFAERAWRGGGKKGWVATLGQPGTKEAIDFLEFENRLMKWGQYYDFRLPFNYAPQSQMVWQLLGPYKNEGDLSKKFPPEYTDPLKITPFDSVIGGTVVLRHWWANVVKGAISSPTENTTCYAVSKIWSNTDTVRNVWIGFNNFSRSYTTDSPPEGEWDLKQSKIWVNGSIIPPPKWTNAGVRGDLEKPLVDEGYEFRPATAVRMKKGWNTVLVKCPVGSFSGSGFGNPVKWMFSFVLR